MNQKKIIPNKDLSSIMYIINIVHAILLLRMLP